MENIKQVVLSLVEGLAIAVAVLWLFLGEWKASAIVAISMPAMGRNTTTVVRVEAMTELVTSSAPWMTRSRKERPTGASWWSRWLSC